MAEEYELVELPCGRHPIFITEMCVLCPDYDKCDFTKKRNEYTGLEV